MPKYTVTINDVYTVPHDYTVNAHNPERAQEVAEAIHESTDTALELLDDFAYWETDTVKQIND